MKRILVLSLCFHLPAAAIAQTTEESLKRARAALAPFDEYFVRDGGRWTAPNPTYEEGSDQPPRYGLEFDRRLGGWAVTTRIFGLWPDGSEQDYWEIVTAWSAEEENVVLYQFGRGGAVLVGAGRVHSDEELEVELHGTGWDGSPFGYRDLFHIRGPDEFVIDAFHPDESGEMKLATSNRWTREPPHP